MTWKSFNTIIGGKQHRTAINNYYSNKSIGIKIRNDKNAADTDNLALGSPEALLHSNVFEHKGIKLLWGQYGGNFPLMRFALSNMAPVCCEIIAVYNAMKLSGYIDKDADFEEFFKISCELEVNAPYIEVTGHFGSDYKKIGDFLNSRAVDFSVCKDPQKIDSIIKESACCIVSYKFDMVKVHTFCCFYENGDFVSINRGSGCLYLWRNNNLEECLREGRLLVGYALRHK